MLELPPTPALDLMWVHMNNGAAPPITSANLSPTAVTPAAGNSGNSITFSDSMLSIPD